MSAGAGMPLHVDIKFVWRQAEGWFSDYPPRTGNGERVMVTEVACRKGDGDLGSQLASHAGQEGLQARVGHTRYAVERKSGKQVTFGQDRAVLGVEGLSADEIARLRERLRDHRVEEASSRGSAQA